MTPKKETRENIVKNQHYIPDSLLGHFVNDDDKVIEVLLRTKSMYPTKTASSMSEKFVYEHDSLKRNTIEKYFAKIDSDIAVEIENIIKEIKQYKDSAIDFTKIKNHIETLLPTFIVFYYRSGALLTEFSSINPNDKIPSLSKKILNDRYIGMLGDTIKNCYNFAIIESAGDFLLSNQYMSTSALQIKSQFFDISNRHIGLKGTLILIPISADYYIVYWNSDKDFIATKDSINLLTEDNIKLINKTIINNSYIKCIGKKSERIQEVLDDYNMSYPSQIYAGGNPDGYFCGAINKKEVFFYDDDKKAYKLLEFATFMQYKELGRNDKCACKSGKKFKKCHLDSYNKIKEVINDFGKPNYVARAKYGIPGAIAFELPVESWEGYKKDN